MKAHELIDLAQTIEARASRRLVLFPERLKDNPVEAVLAELHSEWLRIHTPTSPTAKRKAASRRGKEAMALSRSLQAMLRQLEADVREAITGADRAAMPALAREAIQRRAAS